MAPLPGSIRATMRKNAELLEEDTRRAVRHLEVTPRALKAARLVRDLQLRTNAVALGQRLAECPDILRVGGPDNRRWVHRNFAHLILHDRTPGVA